MRTSSPLASRQPSITSPTGSGSAAMSRTCSAIAATRPAIERQPVHQRVAQPGLAPGLEIARVGLEDLGRALDQRVRDRLERGVLHAERLALASTREARLARGTLLRDVMSRCRPSLHYRLREHEVVAVDRFLGWPAAAARARPRISDRAPGGARPRSSCRSPCPRAHRRRQRRPRLRRRSPRKPPRSRRAISWCRPHAGPGRRRRRSVPGPGSAWRISATA